MCTSIQWTSPRSFLSWTQSCRASSNWRSWLTFLALATWVWSHQLESFSAFFDAASPNFDHKISSPKTSMMNFCRAVIVCATCKVRAFQNRAFGKTSWIYSFSIKRWFRHSRIASSNDMSRTFNSPKMQNASGMDSQATKIIQKLE